MTDVADTPDDAPEGDAQKYTRAEWREKRREEREKHTKLLQRFPKPFESWSEIIDAAGLILLLYAALLLVIAGVALNEYGFHLLFLGDRPPWVDSVNSLGQGLLHPMALTQMGCLLMVLLAMIARDIAHVRRRRPRNPSSFFMTFVVCAAPTLAMTTALWVFTPYVADLAAAEAAAAAADAEPEPSPLAAAPFFAFFVTVFLGFAVIGLRYTVTIALSALAKEKADEPKPTLYQDYVAALHDSGSFRFMLFAYLAGFTAVGAAAQAGGDRFFSVAASGVIYTLLLTIFLEANFKARRWRLARSQLARDADWHLSVYLLPVALFVGSYVAFLSLLGAADLASQESEIDARLGMIALCLVLAGGGAAAIKWISREFHAFLSARGPRIFDDGTPDFVWTMSRMPVRAEAEAESAAEPKESLLQSLWAVVRDPSRLPLSDATRWTMSFIVSVVSILVWGLATLFAIRALKDTGWLTGSVIFYPLVALMALLVSLLLLAGATGLLTRHDPEKDPDKIIAWRRKRWRIAMRNRHYLFLTFALLAFTVTLADTGVAGVEIVKLALTAALVLTGLAQLRAFERLFAAGLFAVAGLFAGGVEHFRYAVPGLDAAEPLYDRNEIAGSVRALAGWIDGIPGVAPPSGAQSAETLAGAVPSAVSFDDAAQQTARLQALDDRPVEPRDAIDAWRARLPAGDGAAETLVLLGFSGGGYRSAYWGALVLDALETQHRSFLIDHVRFMAGASGGMVAAAYGQRIAETQVAAPCEPGQMRSVLELFATDVKSASLTERRLRNAGVADAQVPSARDRARIDPVSPPSLAERCVERSATLAAQAQTLATRDALAGAAAGLHRAASDSERLRAPTGASEALITQPLDSMGVVLKGLQEDLWDVLTPWRTPVERGRRLERHWPSLDVPIAATRALERQGRVPTLIFSPTVLDTGRPLYISNAVWTARSPDPRGLLAPRHLAAALPGALGFVSGPGAADAPPVETTLTLATAARLSASFPFLMPAMDLPTHPALRLGDAGYSDNFGVETLLGLLLDTELRDNLAEGQPGENTRILLIEIRAFEPHDPLARRSGASDNRAPGCQSATEAQTGERNRFFDFAASPLRGVDEVIRARREQLRSERIVEAAAALGSDRFRAVQIVNNTDSSLSWALQTHEMDCMDRELGLERNQKALRDIGKLLESDSWSGLAAGR